MLLFQSLNHLAAGVLEYVFEAALRVFVPQEPSQALNQPQKLTVSCEMKAMRRLLNNLRLRGSRFA